MAKYYSKGLEKVPGLQLPVEMPWAKNVYWMYGILINEGFGLTKDELMSTLTKKGIDTRSFFCPMSLQPVFKSDDHRFPDTSGAYPVSVDLWNRGLYLPSGLGLTRSQLEEVVEKLLSCKA